jgi:hypothetical protein
MAILVFNKWTWKPKRKAKWRGTYLWGMCTPSSYILVHLHSFIVSFYHYVLLKSRSRWPRCLRRGSAAARLLGFRDRISSGGWMTVSCECCVLSGRGLCVGLITRPEESRRARARVCVSDWDCVALIMRSPWTSRGFIAVGKKVLLMWHSKLWVHRMLLLFSYFIAKFKSNF